MNALGGDQKGAHVALAARARWCAARGSPERSTTSSPAVVMAGSPAPAVTSEMGTLRAYRVRTTFPRSPPRPSSS